MGNAANDEQKKQDQVVLWGSSKGSLSRELSPHI